jgi:hypothetical protein
MTALSKLYRALTSICSAFGWLGNRVQHWAELKEWQYWNKDRCKIIEVPNDIHIFIRYNNKGEHLDVSVNHRPLVNGRYGEFTCLSEVGFKESEILKIVEEKALENLNKRRITIEAG